MKSAIEKGGLMTNKEIDHVFALVRMDNFTTCKNCAFFPGGDSTMCFAPWTDGYMEDECIDPCLEGVLKYITGENGCDLQKLIDKKINGLWLREKGEEYIHHVDFDQQ